MNLFYLLLRSSWQIVLMAGLAGLLNGGSTAGLIALINGTLSNFDGGKTTWLGWGFLIASIVLLATHFSSQVLLVKASQGAIFQMRLLLSRQILASPLRTLENIGNPQLLATLTDDIEAVSRSFSILPGLFNAIAIVAGCLIYMAWLSWSTFGIMVGLIAFGVFSYELLAGRANRYLRLAREEQDRLFQHFRALTEGNKELKLNRQRRKAFIRQDLTTTASSYRQYNLRGMTIFATAASWGELLLFVTIGFILFALPQLLRSEQSTVSGYVITIVYLMMPMQQVIEAIPLLSKASVALKKIDSLQLSLANDSLAEVKDEEPEIVPWQQLTLDQVTHSYAGGQGDSTFVFTLGPIDLTFKAGELVFIVGGNGSGKSTLGKLITGLYTPESGSIYVDGQEITEANREWYRQHFSVVFADFFLFDRLLGLGKPDLDARALEYLEKLRLTHKVNISEGHLSTTALSTGERKRLALLTAFLEDRPIYLFDEWASDQDPVFRKFFYTQMLPELRNRGKTIFVISHDDRYFTVADRLIKLDYGKVEYDKTVSNP